MRSFRRNEQGQALVEMALVLPLLLILIMGILQFGQLYNAYNALTDASRAGARELAIGRGLSNPCDPAVQQAVAGTAGDFTVPPHDVSISFAGPNSASTAPNGGDYCGTSTSCPYVYDTSCNTNGNLNQNDTATLKITYSYTIKVFGVGIWTFNLTPSASDAVE